MMRSQERESWVGELDSMVTGLNPVARTRKTRMRERAMTMMQTWMTESMITPATRKRTTPRRKRRPMKIAILVRKAKPPLVRFVLLVTKSVSLFNIFILFYLFG